VRILLDECLPKRLKRDLVGHEARTVPEMGWAGKQNGELLALAEAEFDVFLTVDRNLSFQQPIAKFSIAVVVMVAKGNKLAHLQPLVPEVLAIVGTVTPGQVIRVSGRQDR
jgi:predicted nuclease of predicted toxin-antitoxin system